MGTDFSENSYDDYNCRDAYGTHKFWLKNGLWYYRFLGHMWIAGPSVISHKHNSGKQSDKLLAKYRKEQHEQQM